MLFGLSAFLSDQEGFELAWWERGFLSLALGFLGGAALIGIFIQSPRPYRESKIPWMRGLTADVYWNAKRQEGEVAIAHSRLDIIERARKANEAKAGWLSSAVRAQSFGVLFIALTVISILTLNR